MALACPSCGAENPDEARFCRECGNMFSSAPAAAGAEPPPGGPPPPPPTEPVAPVPPTEAIPATPPAEGYPAGPPVGGAPPPPPPPPPPGAFPPGAPGGPPPEKKRNRAPLFIVLALLVIGGIVAAFLLLGGDDDETIDSAFCDGLFTISEQIASGDDIEAQAETVEALADTAEGSDQEEAVEEVADAYADEDNDQADLADVVQDELGEFAEECELDTDEFAVAPTTTAAPETTATTTGGETTTTTAADGTTTTVVLGTGDVQVTLEWDSDADLDLGVTDPTGEEVSFSNSGPTATGGELDVDSNVGCDGEGSVENIFWPPGQAPAGQYTASVTGFTTDSCSQGAQAGDFVLTIRVAGRPDEVHPGSVSEGQTLTFPFAVG
jgi:hypothetical protein